MRDGRGLANRKQARQFQAFALQLHVQNRLQGRDLNGGREAEASNPLSHVVLRVCSKHSK